MKGRLSHLTVSIPLGMLTDELAEAAMPAAAS